ncbi:hypothetical protein F5H01DRAFT_367759 [Linnemannia elongata]|nr:hypothetical protein F5H01DRAFT_367759 [Linnemannia elongata]
MIKLNNSSSEHATEDQKSTPPSRSGKLLNIVGQEVDTNQRPGETGTTNECLEEPVDADSRPDRHLVWNTNCGNVLPILSRTRSMAMYFLETAPTLHYSTHAVPHRVITPTQLPQHPTANTPCDLFSQVHYVLQHNLLRTCWHSQDSQNQFMASLELGQYTHASLEATFRPEIARSWTNINSDSNYIEALGKKMILRVAAAGNGQRARLDQLEEGGRQKEVLAIGLLHSTVRKAQADRIFARENDFQRRGVVVYISEIPQGLESRETQHRSTRHDPKALDRSLHANRVFHM